MKKFNLTPLLFLLILSTSVSAQNSPITKGISMRALFMDYQSQNGGDLSEFKAYHHGFELGYQQQLTNNFNLYVPFKAGVVNQPNLETDCLHKTIYGLDAQLQYLFEKET